MRISCEEFSIVSTNYWSVSTTIGLKGILPLCTYFGYNLPEPQKWTKRKNLFQKFPRNGYTRNFVRRSSNQKRYRAATTEQTRKMNRLVVTKSISKMPMRLLKASGFAVAQAEKKPYGRFYWAKIKQKSIQCSSPNWLQMLWKALYGINPKVNSWQEFMKTSWQQKARCTLPNLDQRRSQRRKFIKNVKMFTRGIRKHLEKLI